MYIPGILAGAAAGVVGGGIGSKAAASDSPTLESDNRSKVTT